MDQHTAGKTRVVFEGQTVATATATKYPTFPTGPTSGKVTFKGDMLNARVVGFTWAMSDLAGFTDADATVYTSDDGDTWRLVKAFTQKSVDGSETIWLLDTDPKLMRFVCLEVDMTGTPGTSTHKFEVHYDQRGPRGGYADGIRDRNV